MAGMKWKENRANSTTHPAYERCRWRQTWLVTLDHMTLLFCFHDGGLWCHVRVDLSEDYGQTSFHSFLNNLIISAATRNTQNTTNKNKIIQTYKKKQTWIGFGPIFYWDLIHMTQRQTKESHHSCYAAQSTRKEALVTLNI